MERTGEVIAVQGDELLIRFCRPTDCEKCHGCMGGAAQRELKVRGQAQVGDAAVVEMPAGKVVQASLLAYVCPMLGLLAGLFIGAGLFPGAQETAAILGGLIGMAVPLLIVALTEGKRRKDAAWQPKLVRVIPAGQGTQQ